MSPIALDRFPRVALGHLPTPLEPLDRLAETLGGPRLWIKRDDCTGLASGGNKTRKLEFLLGAARLRGADVLVTPGAVQSNHVRQTAAAAARAGLACVALLERAVDEPGDDYGRNANVLIDHLCGAEVRYFAKGTDMEAALAATVAELEAAGRRPYAIPTGGSNPVGALGYVGCALELAGQAAAAGLRLDHVVLATGSAGTQAGLLTGLHALGSTARVLGMCVSRPAPEQAQRVHALAGETAALVGVEPPPAQAVHTNSDYVGPGYGVPTPAMAEALELTARNEGVLLDPVYTGKAMAGLVDLVRRGTYGRDEDVVFLHTGGTVGIFAYRRVFGE